jgi:hypothetical protein
MSQTSAGPVGVGTTARVVRRQGRGHVEGTATVVTDPGSDVLLAEMTSAQVLVLRRESITPSRSEACFFDLESVGRLEQRSGHTEVVA